MSQILPIDKKQLRACLLCSLIKASRFTNQLLFNASQFRSNGCENCEEILQMRGSMDRGKPTRNVALMHPKDSWVGRWQRVDKFQKGVYAIVVYGRVPEDVEDELDRRGVTYRPRDGSVKD
ncbi:hypothetical protein INT46_004255 [Mucor plumbeus]|uniref:Transcription elongation factor SPT4 n=1 Tax=Mucor plumbeus TaxID=97098 RepID=A0A8H7QF36_9FUNG|nr:hypothetical protein INT46_004255 [Mucor plumbeus]